MKKLREVTMKKEDRPIFLSDLERDTVSYFIKVAREGLEESVQKLDVKERFKKLTASEIVERSDYRGMIQVCRDLEIKLQ